MTIWVRRAERLREEAKKSSSNSGRIKVSKDCIDIQTFEVPTYPCFMPEQEVGDKKKRKEQVGKATRSKTSIQKSTTQTSTATKIKTSGLGSIDTKNKRVDLESNVCQIKDIVGNKCKRRALAKFFPLAERTRPLLSYPVCNKHLHDIRTIEEVDKTLKTPEFVRASDL